MTQNSSDKREYSSPDVVCRGSINDVVTAFQFYTTSDGTEISPGQTGGIDPDDNGS